MVSNFRPRIANPRSVYSGGDSSSAGGVRAVCSASLSSTVCERWNLNAILDGRELQKDGLGCARRANTQNLVALVRPTNSIRL